MEKYLRKPIKKTNQKRSGNPFLDAAQKPAFMKTTTTENGAISNSSTGNLFVDDFAKAGAYRMRDTTKVFSIAKKLFNIDSLMALKLFFYLRLITRRIVISKDKRTNKVQRGQGNRDESLRRLLWVAYNHPDMFYRNLWILPLVGSWKDLWTLMSIDTEGKLDKTKFFDLILSGLEDDTQRDLVIKYLPQIKANSKCITPRAQIRNEDAKAFARYANMDFKSYRKLKSSGKAHIWQQKISQRRFFDIDFGRIPGKALFNLVNGKFLKNHNLVDKYQRWLEKQPITKFTGYVFELLVQVRKNWNAPSYKINTWNKQFEGLLETARDNDGAIKGNVWVAVDTSASMTFEGLNKKGVTAYDVAVSLGIYFSALNKGAFKDNIVMFNNVSRLLHLSGSFTNKVKRIAAASTAWGSTNFQSVIDLMVRVRREHPEIPIEDYPETILVVSDLQFNIVGSRNRKTNYEAAMKKLRKVGLKDVKIIWWQVTGRTSDFPSTINDPRTYFFSGFDGSIISLLLGGKEMTTMEQTLEDVLNQDILSLVN